MPTEAVPRPSRAQRTGRAERAERVALIVATGRYDDPKLQQLRAPAADAEQLAAVLEHRDVAGFTVRQVLDQPAQVIRKELHRFLSERRRSDLVLLYFSCHGLKDVDGSLHFAGTDTEMGLLASTGVSAAFVNELVGACRSNRVVIMLDCCYSGAFTRLGTKGDLTVGVQERLEGSGRVVMTASNAMEYAFEDQRLSVRDASPSVFTRAVLQGLATGDADRDGDGRVSVDELYDYVYDEVRRSTSNQTPGLSAHLSGTLYLARTPAGPVLDLPARKEDPTWRRWLRRRLRTGRRPRALVPAAALTVALVVGAAAVALGFRDPGWVEVADLPQPVEAAAVAAYRDRLYVLGGIDPGPGRAKLSTVQVYDPTTQEWSVGNGLPTGVGFAAAVAAGGSLYVIGGLESDGSTDAVHRLDSPDGQWQADRPLPEPRGAGAAAFDGERIVFAGGVSREEGGPVRGDVWAMRLGEEWQPAGQIEPAREKLAAATDGFGLVYFMAGRDRQTPAGEVTYGHVDVVRQTGVTSLGEPLPPLSAPGAVQLPGHGFCVIGGQRPDGGYNAQTHCAEGPPDPAPPDLPTPRAGLGVAVLRDAVYAVGGYHEGTNGTDLVHRYQLPDD